MANLTETAKGFFTDLSDINRDEYIFLKYYFSTDHDPYLTAAHLCQEQSTAQFKRVGIDEDYRPVFAAKAYELYKATNNDLQCGDRIEKEKIDISKGWIVKIAYPIINFNHKLPNLMTAICGEGVFHSPNIDHIKLLDIDFPDSFFEGFHGPSFGSAGIRKQLQIYDRPLMIGVIKPNIGLAPEPFGQLAYKAWCGGLDVAKDDELLCDTTWSPFEDRSRILGKYRLDAEQKTGMPKVYLANITDEENRMSELFEIAKKNHVNSVMMNCMITGLPLVTRYARREEMPIYSHFDFIAPYTKIPDFGLHLQVVIKLQRLAGVDGVIFQGLGSRMGTSVEEVLCAYLACVCPMGNIKPSLAVPGGSQWAGSLSTLYSLFNSYDFGIVPGRAVFSHPSGPSAGAAALLQGWQAIVDNIPINTFAETHPELKDAIKAQES